MDELDRTDPDDVEELAPLEDEVPEAASEDEHHLLSFPALRTLARSYERSPAPYALIDDSLRFVYRNPRFRALLAIYEYESHDSLLATFARSLTPETAGELRAALGNGERGFLWKGHLSHRAKDAPAHLTKMHIQPLWLSEEMRPRPEAYAVYLDDVTEENVRHLRGMFSSLLEASKMKDNDTGRHIERVNLYASRLARELYHDPRWPEVDVDFIEDIGFLAAMHDVGKIGTPDDILNKKGPLSEFEWGIMKEHTKNGAFILSSYPNPMAKEIALSHHERWNGSGYPYNWMGPMIPLAARITTLADVYDALRMRRSYKPAYPHQSAVAKIREDRGIHFDPELVDVFLKIEEDLALIFAENADEFGQ
ncbi:MAG: HD-GYP domain-containing protein [Spirochaetaceae bacterium]|nr:HD-GYP domain-containing protein [Spirochaetaceae bacterium]